jgi:hypothetical protein
VSIVQLRPALLSMVTNSAPHRYWTAATGEVTRLAEDQMDVEAVDHETDET